MLKKIVASRITQVIIKTYTRQQFNVIVVQHIQTVVKHIQTVVHYVIKMPKFVHK